MGSRVSIHQVPSTPRICQIGDGCVYREGVICSDPRTNKGNSDALCHLMNNKDLLLALAEMPHD